MWWKSKEEGGMSGVLGALLDVGVDGEDLPDDTRIHFNVGGCLHETVLATLRRFPHSRLCQLATEAYSSTSGAGDTIKTYGPCELFLDRDPRLFAVILNLYRCGELHMPSDVCGPAMRRELSYWGVEELDMEPCCWMNYSTFADTKATLDNFRREHLEDVATFCHQAVRMSKRMRLFRFLSDPYSSAMAKIYAWVMLGVVFLSILVYCLETHPDIAGEDMMQVGNTSVDMMQVDYQLFHGKNVYGIFILVIVDNICNAIFLMEFLVHLAVAPNRWRFLKSALSVIEILCLVPYYIAVTIMVTTSHLDKYRTVLQILFLFRVLRILRIFTLMRHFEALKILVYTLRASTQELLLLVLILSLGMLLFASLMFQVESHTNGRKCFRHVFDALWWALVTMTTVGYGDLVPSTPWGFFVGSLCATSGILVIALTVPIIVNNFTLYYSHAQSERKLYDRRQAYKVPTHQTPRPEIPPCLMKKRKKILSFNDVRLAALEEDVFHNKQKIQESNECFTLEDSISRITSTSNSSKVRGNPANVYPTGEAPC